MLKGLQRSSQHPAHILQQQELSWVPAEPVTGRGKTVRGSQDQLLDLL